MGLYTRPRKNPMPLDALSDDAIRLLSIVRRSKFCGVRPGSPFGEAAHELAAAGFVSVAVCECCGILAVAGVPR